MNEALYSDTMQALQDLWSEDEFIVSCQHHIERGIRSSQIASVIRMLIKMGVINETNIQLLRAKESEANND